MLKSARFLSRSMLNNLGILFLFEGACAAGVLALKDSDNIFGTYLGACTMMILIIVMVMGANWTQSLVQVGCPHTRFAGQKNNLYNGKG